MRPHALSAQELVAVWEAGGARHPVDRALLLLAAALPHHTHDELAALPVGRRDALLLRVREATLGPVMACASPCPRCGARLEFPADVGTLLHDAPPEDAPREQVARGGGLEMRFRLLDSRDLALSARMETAEDARQALLRACLAAVRPLRADGGQGADGLLSADDGARSLAGGSASAGGWEPPPAELDEAALAALCEALLAADPIMELRFTVKCVCGHRWSTLLEPSVFVWAEVAAAARRLLREVDRLARAYGWGQAEILEMSAALRGAYLELVP